MAGLRRLFPLLILAAAALGLAACAERGPSSAVGDAARGKDAILRASCGSCHRIPGIDLADGTVGPSLAGFGRRSVIAGFWPNTPDHLAAWLLAPQRLVPGNVMPSTGLSPSEARDVAAYLQSLG